MTVGTGNYIRIVAYFDFRKASALCILAHGSESYFSSSIANLTIIRTSIVRRRIQSCTCCLKIYFFKFLPFIFAGGNTQTADDAYNYR